MQVIVGTFFLDAKKDGGTFFQKGDAPGSKLASLVGESVSSLGYQPGIESSGGNPVHGNDDDHHAVGGSHFMIQQRGVHVTPSQPTEWWARPDSRNAGFEQMTGMKFLLNLHVVQVSTLLLLLLLLVFFFNF